MKYNKIVFGIALIGIIACKEKEVEIAPSVIEDTTTIVTDVEVLNDTTILVGEEQTEVELTVYQDGKPVKNPEDKIGKTYTEKVPKVEQDPGMDNEAKELSKTQPDKAIEQVKVENAPKQADQPEAKVESKENVKPDHGAFNQMLKKYVSASGDVNYSAWKKDMGGLEDYLEELSKVRTEPLSDKEAMAYWINLYNAATIHKVLENFPLNSIKDLNGGKVWDTKIVEIAGGKKISLNQIENEILRPVYKDPRIHFVINCAAKSCPPIDNQALTSDNLYAVLEQRTKEFVKNNRYNDITEKKMEISSIFDWYKEDFGDLYTFIAKYSGVDVSSKTKVAYKKYDWSLNGS